MHVETRAQDEPSAPLSEDALAQHGLYRLGLGYGRLVHRFRWLLLLLWAAALVGSLPFAARVSSVLTGGGYSYSNSESARVQTLVAQKLNVPAAQLLVVFESANTPVSDPAYQQEIAGVIDRARTFPHVATVQQGGVSPDGRTTVVAVNFAKDADHVEQQLPAFAALVPRGADATNPARTYITGGPAIYSEFNHITEQDVKAAESAALPIALVVLLIVFGSLVAAAMPLLLALVAVPVALAVIYAIALRTQTNSLVLNIATIIGLGISIDYSLFLVRRFRDELASGRAVREAVAWTVATSGEAIFFSGLTVMIGFAGLLLIGIPFMTSFGTAGLVTVGLSMLAALTLLPALMSVLGPRINALRIPLLWRLTGARGPDGQPREGGFWHRWALGVMRRPVLILLAVLVLLVAMGWPIFQLRVGTPGSAALPASSEARQGLDVLNRAFPAMAENPVYLLVQSPDGSSMLTPQNLARVDAYSRWLSVQAHVTGVTSLTRLPATPGAPALSTAQLTALYTTGTYTNVPALAQLVQSTTNGDTTLISVSTNAPLDSPEGQALIDFLRQHRAAGDGLTVLVGGFQAVTLDFARYLYGNFPRSILFILVATFLLLLVMFRSVLLPLKAVLMNVLSLGAAYGVLVFGFQWGNFEQILNFTKEGFIDSTLPIIMFCVIFGLSMDYEVFLLSRIREEWLRTQNNRFAVARGLEKTGGVITNAALLFVLVTGAFAFTSLVATKEIGVGMTVAVLVDATIIRTLLVPATMRLLGRWNWWLPGRPLPPRQPA